MLRVKYIYFKEMCLMRRRFGFLSILILESIKISVLIYVSSNTAIVMLRFTFYHFTKKVSSMEQSLSWEADSSAASQ